MKARYAFPLLALVALVALIAGAVTGVVFLIVVAALGLLAAIVGGIWAGRRAAHAGDPATGS